MVDILLIATIIILLVVSMWLFRTIKKENAGLDIKTSLSPETSVHGFLNPPIKMRQILLWKIQEIIFEIKVRIIKNLYTRPKLSIDPSGSYCACDGGGDDFSWPLQRIVRYNGFAKIPIKVYQGDSSTITLTLNPSSRNPNRNEKPIKVYRQGDRVSLTLTVSSREKEYLEVELMAAGFSVDGEKKQKQLLLSDSLQYQWNCFFEKSGTHSFAFIFRVVDSTDRVLQIGRIEQVIKVAQIDHLTQRQVWILASAAGILSGILTLAEILKNLGVW